MPANAIAGSAFEKDALDALGGHKNTTTFYVNGTATIPDAVTDTHVVEIKGGRQISLTRQLRAQLELARNTGRQFILVVGPNAQRISTPLVNAIKANGGKILTYYGRGDRTGIPFIGDSTNRY